MCSKGKKQSASLSKERHLEGSSIAHSEPHVFLERDKVVHNIEMRDTDNAPTTGEERESLSKSDLDDIKSYVKNYIDMKFNDLRNLMVDHYKGFLEVVKEVFDSYGKYIDVVFYYLCKKEKLDTTGEYRYTIVNCMFKNYIHGTYTHYHQSQSEIYLSSQEENVRSMKVASVVRSICDIIQGLCIPVGISWHLVDEVYVPINYEGSFHWMLAVIVLKERSYLSDVHQLPSSEFDPEMHRTIYTSFLWDYGMNKASNGYVSDNQDPPRPKGTFIPSEDTKMIDVEM
ncbi:hypothetical protein CQW23_21175 [Capsicum baccatum]|uniref:Ubiquitin-like protease family profile domain-containing protein n=1 Tax=Capsicum baccatum TaxID=33114 RepID=A0A2G2VX98_CAPBA|nr:hypothetical protein CQW23_21175 [Capsicum baccatum]